MSAATTPLLSILSYRLAALSIEPDPTFRADAVQQARVQTSFGIGRHASEVQRFTVMMASRFFKEEEGENVPYVAGITLLGEFISNYTIDPDGLPKALANNALVLLYGIARGVVGQVTGAGINGMFTLPSMSFEDLIEQSANSPGSGVIHEFPSEPKKDGALETSTGDMAASPGLARG